MKTWLKCTTFIFNSMGFNKKYCIHLLFRKFSHFPHSPKGSKVIGQMLHFLTNEVAKKLWSSFPVLNWRRPCLGWKNKAKYFRWEQIKCLVQFGVTVPILLERTVRTVISSAFPPKTHPQNTCRSLQRTVTSRNVTKSFRLLQMCSLYTLIHQNSHLHYVAKMVEDLKEDGMSWSGIWNMWMVTITWQNMLKCRITLIVWILVISLIFLLRFRKSGTATETRVLNLSLYFIHSKRTVRTILPKTEHLGIWYNMSVFVLE